MNNTNETPLRTERMAAELTAFKLAQMAGTSELRIFQIERNRFRPRSEEARRLAVVLNVPVRKLFPNGVQEE